MRPWRAQRRCRFLPQLLPRRPGLDSALTMHSPRTYHVLLVNVQAGPRLRTRDSRGDAVRRGRGARASRTAEADRGSSLPLTYLLYLVTYYLPRDDTPQRLCPEPPLLSTPQPSVLQPHPRPHPSPQTQAPPPQTEACQAPAHSPRPHPPRPPHPATPWHPWHPGSQGSPRDEM